MKLLTSGGAWRLGSVAALLAVVGLALSGCASQGNSPTQGSGQQVVSFAELASTPPTYISPLMPAAHESNANLYQFSNFMYLPLYWFGGDGEPILNKDLSVADPPTFSDNNTVATVQLKHWEWSDGQPITARDVIFWMNLLSAVTDPTIPSIGSASAPGPGYFASVPGGFPQNVVSYQQTGTYTMVFHMNRSYNPKWFLFNELSQVYPLPTAKWDQLSAGGSIGNYDMGAEARELAPASDGLPADSYLPVDPGTATSGALGVAQAINIQASTINTYASNPFWKTVDGPFQLTQFTTDGYCKFVPNKNYSGSPKPKLSAFELLPFTTNAAEVNALRAGQVTIGYLPAEDYSERASFTKAGYELNPWYLFGFVYAGINFTNPTVGPIFKQLYFRQAMQSLINQKQWIDRFDDGIGAPDNGPVPTYPPGNPDESSLEAHGQVYPYDPTKAVSLLKDHGWKVVPGGTSYCSDPGTASNQCGAGIKQGQQASFSLHLASGNAEATNEMAAMQSTYQSVAGIDLSVRQEPFATIIGEIGDGCSPKTPCSQWEIDNWIGGWSYDPDFFPTGEEIFETGAASDVGDYSNPTNDSNIVATNTAPNNNQEIKDLDTYQNFLAENLPCLFLPNVPQQFTMFKKNLNGFLPQDVYDIIYPQDYSLS
ncbi:MAG: ABC transporter substrate-binding protein [Candidatus Dormibacteria bacterium]